MRKQRQIDEEKRVRIQELRNSGQLVGSRRDEVPFGVRAIQSGIEVDGIWISNPNSPVSSIRKLGNFDGSSSELTTIATSSSSPRASEGPSQHPSWPNLERQWRPQHTFSHGSSLDQASCVYDASDVDSAGSPRHRAPYKPRRSSQLRFGSDNQQDDDTLDQLEGKGYIDAINTALTLRPTAHTRNHSPDIAADNELTSDTSSDSTATLSNNTRLERDDHHPIRISSAAALPTLVVSNRHHAERLKEDRGEYFSVPLDSPGRERSDPFVTPRSSPVTTSAVFTPAVEQPGQPPETTAELQVPLLSQRPLIPGRPSFVPGSLHMNTSVRRVNSGFEVLPAGTFGTIVDSTDKRMDRWSEDEEGGEKKHPSKLQKRARHSISSGRPLSTGGAS